MKKIGIFIFIGTLFMNMAYAQKPKMKYGKVSKEELEMKYCDFDSTASAVILFDKGRTFFEYDSEFKLNFERHVRIKIFKKEAYKYATHIVSLYKDGLTVEKLYQIKGNTYNFVNGKVEKVKIKNSEIIKEDVSDNRKDIKITFSDIKEGSIIDFKYNILSDFTFNLQHWKFQYNIPVIYSEYYTLVPEYFNYNPTVKGFDNVKVAETKDKKDEEFKINYLSMPAGQTMKNENYFIKSHSLETEWIARNIPAFVVEKYITTRKDYMTRIDFELASVQYPNQIIENYSMTWDGVYKKLLNSSDFGLKVTPSIIVKSLLKKIYSDSDTEKDKISKIYNYVKSKTNCIEYFGIYTTQLQPALLSKGKGNVGDINILLVSMLKAAGVKADPVVLSTRSNGKVFPFYPTISKFNYVIVLAEIDGKKTFLDATNDLLPIGYLPYRCLNGEGRIISKEGSGPVAITAPKTYNTTSTYFIDIDEEKGLIGKVNKTYKNYASYFKRNQIFNAGDSASYVKKIKEDSENEEIEDVEIQNITNINKPIILNYKLNSSDNINFAGNMIYLTPLLNERTEDNPFKLEERKYPVDYAYPLDETFIFQYTIPEGYEVSEIPKSVIYALPENAARYTFSAKTMGNKIQIMSKFSINRTVFNYNEYKDLKSFYNVVIEKQSEKIVLKKK